MLRQATSKFIHAVICVRILAGTPTVLSYAFRGVSPAALTVVRIESVRLRPRPFASFHIYSQIVLEFKDIYSLEIVILL